MATELPPSLKQSLENSKCEYRNLGNSGLKVSVPIFGCMSFGDKKSIPWAIEEEEALPLLKFAYDQGLNTWDTANMYSQGVSETIVGKALKKYAIPREKVVILTKCYFGVGETPDVNGYTLRDVLGKSKDYVNQHGLSRAAIFNAVDASLKRLDTEYIDLLQVHRFDYDTPIEETMKALHDLVVAGKVRYIGACTMWATNFARMQFVAEKNGWTKFISMQNHYNLLYREEERETNRFCNATGVGIIPWAPLCRGHLARPPPPPAPSSDSTPTPAPAPPTARAALEKAAWPDAHGTVEPDLTIIRRVAEVAARRGCTMAQVALAWVARRAASPIVGFSSEDRVREALGMRGVLLDAERDERYLEELYRPKEVVGHW
ncbi:NADP-dependent oxidoreductase domain-containing protein [Biscogniauxia mediterranea]|nr:NADP-dependent oxidoreductase domain-containing protein [Biscogniauxia mediterranea]